MDEYPAGEHDVEGTIVPRECQCRSEFESRTWQARTGNFHCERLQLCAREVTPPHLSQHQELISGVTTHLQKLGVFRDSAQECLVDRASRDTIVSPPKLIERRGIDGISLGVLAPKVPFPNPFLLSLGGTSNGTIRCGTIHLECPRRTVVSRRLSEGEAMSGAQKPRFHQLFLGASSRE